MGEPEVVLERRGAVARIVLNRPVRRNALGRQTLPVMHAVLDEVERDPSIGAVVVTGRGPVFCAGGVDEGEKKGEKGDRLLFSLRSYAEP